MQRSSRITKLSIGYTLFIGLWVFTRLLFGDRFLLLAVLNTFAEYLFIPLPFVILESLYHRNRFTPILAIPAGFFIMLWGAQYLPSPLPTYWQETPRLRVMTYNVQSANQAPHLLATSILNEFPDLVGFQELSRRNLPTLQEDIKTRLPYTTFDLSDGRLSDVGLASRFPILSAERISFPPRDTAIHAVVDWDGLKINVFVVHFSSDNFLEFQITEYPELERENLADRALEVTRLMEELDNLYGPVIIFCDCNFTDTSATYKQMSARLFDTFKRKGWGPGHTLHPPGFALPVLRIDYIWHNLAFFPVSSHVGDRQSSDHHPVISVLGLREKP